jgi:hypothetical protein
MRTQKTPANLPTITKRFSSARRNGGYGTSGSTFVFSRLVTPMQVLIASVQIMLLNSPVVPLTFRSIIWVLSLLALALAGSIFHMSNQYNVPQEPSTIMAIVVDAIALLYLIWITYDEYSGKPLGLRSPSAKIRLSIFLVCPDEGDRHTDHAQSCLISSLSCSTRQTFPLLLILCTMFAGVVAAQISRKAP